MSRALLVCLLAWGAVACGGASHEGASEVSLAWDAVQTPDVAGYYVYRSLTPGDGYIRITPRVVREPTYVDRTVRPGTTYYYRVTTVSQAGVESEPSAEIARSVE